MRPRDAKGRFVSTVPVPIINQPTLLQSLPAFAVLILLAVIWYFLKWPILVFGSIGVFMVLLIHTINWCGERWPRTTLYVGWFILGMLRGMRRR